MTLPSFLVRRIARDYIGARREERIYLAGNVYARDYLEGILTHLLKVGAKVTTNFWTDLSLLTQIVQSRPEDVTSLWMPEPISGKKVRVQAFGECTFDKVVTLFSSALSKPAVEYSQLFGIRKAEFTSLYKRFREQENKNLSGLTQNGVRVVLLDIPSPEMCSKAGHEYRRTISMYRKALSVSSKDLGRIGRTLVRFFQGKKNVRITCPRGTDFSFNLGPHHWRIERHAFDESNITQIPGGEVFVPPDETTGEGHVIARREGRLLRVEFEKGIAMRAFEKKGDRFVHTDHPLANGREYFCEFGVGTNPSALPIPVGPVYEKALGTVHVGVGGNAFFGGHIQSDRHGDFIILKPTVEVDGEVILHRGRYVHPMLNFRAHR